MEQSVEGLGVHNTPDKLWMMEKTAETSCRVKTGWRLVLVNLQFRKKKEIFISSTNCANKLILIDNFNVSKSEHASKMNKVNSYITEIGGVNF